MGKVLRDASGRWNKGASANPGGFTSEERQQLRALKKLCLTNAQTAIAKMIALMNCGSPSVEFAAAKDLLDRAGLKSEILGFEDEGPTLNDLSDAELDEVIRIARERVAGATATGSSE